MYTKISYCCSAFGHILFFTIIFFFPNLYQNQRNLPTIIEIDLVSETVYEKIPVFQPMDERYSTSDANQSQFAEIPKSNDFLKSKLQTQQTEMKRSIKKTLKMECVNNSREKNYLNNTIQHIKQQARINETKHRIQSAGETKSTVELMDIYKAEVMACIQRNWALSYQLIADQPKLSATLVFTIMKSGYIHSDIWLKKKSGNDYFDECVIKAVKNANPLPPLPNGYLRSYYGPIGLKFTPSGLK